MNSHNPDLTTSTPEFEVKVNFYSFFKELAGCASSALRVPAGSTLNSFVNLVLKHFPRLEPLRKSMLVAVGVEYQDRNYLLQPGDEVSLFPPVQGG
jgi:molybdopterin synthase sulfur carrier subunit